MAYKLRLLRSWEVRSSERQITKNKSTPNYSPKQLKDMKTLKTLTVAVAAAASLALSAMSAKAGIGIVTNYDTVNFSATLTTNGIVDDAAGYKSVIGSQRFVTKDLLTLLTNSDFAGTNFPVDSKLVLGWDGNWNGDLLVVDKTGTNVLYDATAGNPTNNITINLYNQTGSPTYSATHSSLGININNLVWHNNGSFMLIDQAGGVNIAGTGPCTDHFNLKDGFSASTNVASWTDSETFTMYGANETNGNGGFIPGTLTGSITVSGSGKGLPTYLINQNFGLYGP